MRKIYLTIIIAGLFSVNNVKSQNILAENFDNLPALFSTGGWVQQNNSVPLGMEIWHNGDGNGLGIPAFNGDTFSFAEASFNSTDIIGSGNISNWLISPTVNVSNGDVVSFYTTSFNNVSFPDRLELRLNTLNTVNVGTNDTSVADFNKLLLSINPNLLLDTAQYPQDYWKQFSATISGLSGPTSCRIAFRYFVTNGGGGANSSTIGIDAFSVDLPVGIHETLDEASLSIYPNPASDHVSVDFGKILTENGYLRIYNTLGQTVTSFPVMKGQTKALFSISNFANGSYSIVLTGSGFFSKKNFIKN
jgi:hypothetical protein